MSIRKQTNAKIRELSVSEAGKLGGLAVLRKYGKSHFIEIGKLGQKITRMKYPGKASVWGKRGGRPRKTNSNFSVGEPGNQKEGEEADPSFKALLPHSKIIMEK